MKSKWFRKLKIICLSIILLVVVGLIFPTWTSKIEGANSISELKQVEINGTNHEMMIRGKDMNNPIIIFVHGGPGCSEIPYVTKYQDLLENDFTIVQYDQRASGKSYHFFEDYSNLSTDVLVDDLLTVTDYISDRFKKEKVILVGHSFGTYIATLAAHEAPEKYQAYIGIGQMADTYQAELDSLNYCIAEAKKSANAVDYEYLQGLLTQMENGEISVTPRYYVRKYGGAARLIDDNMDYLTGFLFGSEYNLLDVIRYSCGVAFCQDILILQAFDKPLTERVTTLDLPFYFIMGKYDYMTSTSAARNYFDVIRANAGKDFIVYENSAHYPQFENREKFHQWMFDNFAK
ncbi:MAG: alpha/beta fold hydrolase [Anaerotignaceae bacterium]